MASKKVKGNDASLPFAALQLLAPPVRLVSAAIWKVMKQKDVMQFGVVEEFVTSACETAPQLLNVKHQGKLVLGLRGRLILELCRKQPDANVIELHLKRFCVPAAAFKSSASSMRKYVKITETVVSFHRLVQTLLRDPEAREEFFKEKFLVDYGATFDQELEKLMWEFLIRLDQLLPVPSLSQTVSWLSAAPPVLEVCAQAATQPQLLKILLQHETCLGHLESAASLPPNMGDSILASLSLPPSGKVSSNQVTGPGKCSVGQSDCPHRDKPPFIAPVIGLISNEDVPFMNSAGKNNQRGDAPAGAREAMHTHLSPKCFTGVKELQVKGRSSGVKRKQPAEGGNTSDEEDAVLTRSGMPSGGRSHADLPTQLLCRMDTSLQSMFASYLKSQPSVVIEKLSAANWPGRGGKSPSVPQQSHRRKTPVGTPSPNRSSSRLHKLDSHTSNLDDKENRSVVPSLSSSPRHRRRLTETSAPPGDDYVADSEDEATKNFKGRLFLKRYVRTRHGTYVPTLREFWKPGAAQRTTTRGSKTLPKKLPQH